jgi:hypothetical protein
LNASSCGGPKQKTHLPCEFMQRGSDGAKITHKTA